jgi:hypothetical protein
LFYTNNGSAIKIPNVFKEPGGLGTSEADVEVEFEGSMFTRNL